MSTTLNIFVLFLSISLCRGNTGSIPDGLLERIKALEQRERVHISHIEFLENRVNDYNTELENMQEANVMLRQDLKDTTIQLQDKAKMIEEVRTDMKDLQQKYAIQQGAVRNLEAEVTLLKQTDEILRTLADSPRDKNNEEDKSSIHEQEEDNGDHDEDFYETFGRLNYTDGAQKSVPRTQKMRPFAEATNHLLNGERKKRSSLIRSVKSLSGSVAFHAVLSITSVSHLGTTQPIVFNHVMLNLGNGYHNQHGFFIAPKSGLYMFSVSITTYPNKYFIAKLIKDGQLLARILGPSVSERSQGSVTVLTQLNQGNEVWVSYADPLDGSIYGNYDTSFCGILLIEA